MRRRVVLFCGGSGARELVKMYTGMDHVELTILVNCYDDGLSTGLLRDCIAGMLGPSDVRKNVRHSLQRDTPEFASLAKILDFRFRDDLQGSADLNPLPVLQEAGVIDNLSRRRATLFQDAVERFSSYVGSMEGSFSFGDVSLGNVLFAGMYLGERRDFNETVRALAAFAGIRNRVLNLTDGTDLRLVGLTDGSLVVPNEFGISSLRSSDKVADIFLLEDYLAERDMRLVGDLGERAKHEYLTARSRAPRMNPEVRDSILRADVIIYWPGTQHSSLFPSYLTNELAETVMESRAGSKVLIMNTWRDNDIWNESAASLVEKFFWYMSRKGDRVCESELLVTDMLLHAPCADTEGRALPLGPPMRPYRGVAVRLDEWGDRRGKHDVRKVLPWLS